MVFSYVMRIYLVIVLQNKTIKPYNVVAKPDKKYVKVSKCVSCIQYNCYAHSAISASFYNYQVTDQG